MAKTDDELDEPEDIKKTGRRFRNAAVAGAGGAAGGLAGHYIARGVKRAAGQAKAMGVDRQLKAVAKKNLRRGGKLGRRMAKAFAAAELTTDFEDMDYDDDDDRKRGRGKRIAGGIIAGAGGAYLGGRAAMGHGKIGHGKIGPAIRRGADQAARTADTSVTNAVGTARRGADQAGIAYRKATGPIRDAASAVKRTVGTPHGRAEIARRAGNVEQAARVTGNQALRGGKAMAKKGLRRGGKWGRRLARGFEVSPEGAKRMVHLEAILDEVLFGE